MYLMLTGSMTQFRKLCGPSFRHAWYASLKLLKILVSLSGREMLTSVNVFVGTPLLTHNATNFGAVLAGVIA